jgi:hypothetical protein
MPQKSLAFQKSNLSLSLSLSLQHYTVSFYVHVGAVRYMQFIVIVLLRSNIGKST